MAELDQTAVSLVERLRRLDCCAVSDACDRLRVGRVVAGVPQASGTARIAGVVTTVKLGIGEPPVGPPRHLGTLAIEASGSNHVIVVEQRSGIDAGSWGGILTLGARMREVAGVVVDGPVRDIDEAQSYGFPVFTRSFTARTARGRIVELGTDVPISFEGVRVSPGDFVLADRSGIAFLNADVAEAVVSAAEGIAGREAAMAKALLSGRPISQVMGGDYEMMLEERK